MQRDAGQDQEHAAQGVFVNQPSDQRGEASNPNAARHGYYGNRQVTLLVETDSGDDERCEEAAGHSSTCRRTEKHKVSLIVMERGW